VSFSVGGVDPFDDELVRGVRSLARELHSPFVSDHLCWATHRGRHYLDLLPLPRNADAVAHVAARVRELRDRLDVEIALENIAYYADVPECELDEPAFLSAVLEEADAGFLLDVANVVVNAANHGGDPETWLLRLPLHRARQIHVAGHSQDGHFLLDDHGSAPPRAVERLLQRALEVTGPVPVLLEWDTDVPALDELLDAADRLRSIVRSAAA
jgi:hypothetical protein